MAKTPKPSKATGAPAKAAASASTQAPARIPWPPLALPSHAPLPTPDNSLLPGIITIDPLFTRKQVQAFLALLTGPHSPITLEPSPPAKRGEALRTNERFSVQDPAFAKALWEGTALKTLLSEGRLRSEVDGMEARGLNGNIRIYRYTPGSKFNPHYDNYSEDPVSGYRSEWTLLVYLTGAEDGVLGGQTAFYPSNLPGNKHGATKTGVLVETKAGMALLHKHGDDCMLHEGRLVEKGVKWVLRSDVMFG